MLEKPRWPSASQLAASPHPAPAVAVDLRSSPAIVAKATGLDNRVFDRARLTPARTAGAVMLKNHVFPIKDIYVPAKRRTTLRPEAVKAIAESMLEVGQLTPIQVRRDGERLVLVEGLHRLEACKALGEETIVSLVVQARPH